MRLSMSTCKQATQPLVNFRRALKMETFFRRKDKVVFVVGPTGTGKSRLAIDLATHFPAEVVNCDKMQVYKGLDIVTNKVTEEECRGIPHHLLSIVDPIDNFTVHDFRHHATNAVESILTRDKLPIIAGGSNSYIEALVNDDPKFGLKYEFCFLWVYLSLPVLDSFVSERVDRMVKAGLVDEVRHMFDPNWSNYSRGVRRAIGVPELDQYLRNEATADSDTQARLLDAGIASIKENTRILARKQLQKIERLYNRWNWNMHSIDATEVFSKSGEEANEAWDNLVLRPSTMIIDQFLYNEDHVPDIVVPLEAVTVPISAMAAMR